MCQNVAPGPFPGMNIAPDTLEAGLAETNLVRKADPFIHELPIRDAWKMRMVEDRISIPPNQFLACHDAENARLEARLQSLKNDWLRRNSETYTFKASFHVDH